MNNNLKPFLLKDKSRFQEIFDLRVIAHENSENAELINRNLFPNGWFDSIENSGLHWVIENENSKIIASARLNILTNINEIEYHSIFEKYKLPTNKPFGFLSRLVIHPNFRGVGLAKELDEARLLYLKSNKIEYALATAQDARAKSLIKYGFKLLGIDYVQFLKIMQPDREHILIVFPNKIKLPL
jgi:predicted GNAT family N-acyltransferase